MINKDNDYSTDTETIKPTIISSHENNSTMSSNVPVGNFNDEERSVQNTNNDQINGFIENESHVQKQDKDEEEEAEDDEFIRITAAHQMLTEAQTYEEQKNYPAALHLYRICVDLLLEELMFTEGTEQSRVYLREKCTAIMDRIDVLKTMLDPIPPSTSPPSTTNEQTTNPPTDELSSLHLT